MRGTKKTLGMAERLAGQFVCVGRPNDRSAVIGCIGGLDPESLSGDEVRYMASWYIGGFPSKVEVAHWEVSSEYGGCTLGLKFNGFLHIETEPIAGYQA